MQRIRNERLRSDSREEITPATNPVLFVGAPRSGTTAIFERFAVHPELAWVSNYSRLFPKWLAVNLARRIFDNDNWHVVGAKNQFGDKHWFNWLLPRPDESYAFWESHTRKDFSHSYLLGEIPDEAVIRRLRLAFARIALYQGKHRVSSKLTGPGRICYLNRVFPDAYFVHVVRDAFAVVRSLLHVDFWIQGGGYERPWWNNGLTAADLEYWNASEQDPAVLAALQWRRIVETTTDEARALAPERFISVRYEDFCDNPDETITRIWKLTGLGIPSRACIEEPIRTRSYGNAWSTSEVKKILGAIEPMYSKLGYSPPQTADGLR